MCKYDAPLALVRFIQQKGFRKRSIDTFDIPRPVDIPLSRLHEAGEAALRNGEVAVLMPAGGLSTRMGGALRLALPIGPVTNRSILTLQLTKLVAVRKRYNAKIPLVVVTSDAVRQKVRTLLKKHNDLGLPEEDIRFIVQPSLPVVDKDGNAVFLKNSTLLKAPMGHGSIVTALKMANVLPALKRRGIKYLFHFQYPNVMEIMCDAALIGAHILERHDATLKTADGHDIAERVGRLCLSDSRRLRVAEYYETKQLADSKWVTTLPVNLGTYVWRLAFLERFIHSGANLPVSPVPHVHSDIDVAMWKAEQFIFDLMDFTDASGFVKVERDHHYAIVKNQSGPDSLNAARKRLNGEYCAWLATAKAVTDHPNPTVEICPSFADSADTLAQKLAPGFHYTNGMVLR